MTIRKGRPTVSLATHLLFVRIFALSVMLLGVAAGSVRASALDIRPVAVSGQEFVDGSIVAQFKHFFYSRIGDTGDVVFRTTLESSQFPANGQQAALFAGVPGDLTRLMWHGQHFPEIDGTPASEFHATINESGGISVISNLNREVGYDRDAVIWTGTTEGVQVAVREGDRAPGISNTSVFGRANQIGTEQAFEGVEFDGDGNLTFRSVAREPDSDYYQSGLWSGPVSGLQLIALSDTQAPGLTDGVKYRGLFGHNRKGNLLTYKGQVYGPGLTHLNDSAIWGGDVDNIELIAIAGTPAPGIESAVFSVLNYSGPPEIDALGRILFPGSVAGVGVTSLNQSGYWLAGENGPELLFRSNDPVPGNEEFVLNWIQVELVDTDQYLVTGNLDGPGVTLESDGAMFLGSPDDLRLLVREGMLAPGAGGAVFRQFMVGGSPGIPTTPSGQVAFQALLTGDTVNASNDMAYYLTTPGGELLLVAREGDYIDIGGGVLKQIDYLDNSFHLAPIDARLNASGQLLFGAWFTDGTEGLFLAEVDENSPLAGDTNDDGIVDLQDLNNVRNNFGGHGLGDANGDNIVDLEDLNSVRNHFGAVRPSLSVPEPSSMTIAVLIAIASCIRLRLRRPEECFRGTRVAKMGFAGG